MSFEQKVDVIKRRSAELESKVNSLADLFLKKLIDEFVDRLDTKDGVIQNTPGNLALLNQIDRLFLEFNARVAGPQITETVAKGVKEIHGLNMDYFQQFSDGQAQYKATADQVEKIMLDRLGFGEKTKLKEGGFMDTMFKDPTIANQIKNFARTELIKGPGFKDFKTGLGRLIKTDQNSMGAFERYYRNYAYDLFVNVDREESLLTAKALNLTYFIYAGTIIDTSRDFCRKRVGKVFTTEEADAWKDDDWIKNALTKGYIASYDPVRDMGLFGCRHVPQFVSKEVAERMRPDLKAKAEPKKETPPAPEPKKPEFKESKTPKEAEKYAMETLGVQYANFKGLHIDIVNGMNRAIFETKERFPDFVVPAIGNAQAANKEMRETLIDFYKNSEFYKTYSQRWGIEAMDKRAKAFANQYIPKVGSGVIAWSFNTRKPKLDGVELDMSKFKGVYLSDKYGKSPADVAEVVKGNRAIKWFAEGSEDFRYIMTHEIGHELDKFLGIKDLPEFKTIFDREHKLGKDSIKEKLSRYAATAGGRSSHLRDEMIAEAWAEYVTAEKPRELAKEIGDLIVEQYKKRNK